MALSITNDILTSTSYTKRGNKYQKSNYGKIAGLSTGILASSFVGIKGYNMLKNVQNYEVTDSELASALRITPFEGGLVDSAKLDENILKIRKYNFKYGSAILAAISLIGLSSIGLIADIIVNAIRRKNADKITNLKNNNKV